MAATPGISDWIASLWPLDGSISADDVGSESVVTLEVRGPDGSVWARLPRPPTTAEWVAAVETSLSAGLASYPQTPQRGDLQGLNRARAVVVSSPWVASGTLRAHSRPDTAQASEVKAIGAILDMSARMPGMLSAAIEITERTTAATMTAFELRVRDLQSQLEAERTESNRLRAELREANEVCGDLLTAHRNAMNSLESRITNGFEAVVSSPKMMSRLDAILKACGVVVPPADQG